MEQYIKPPVEVRYREELEALKANDTASRPENWQMSPRAVRTFILGSAKPVLYNGKEYTIEKKYFGNDALVEVAFDGVGVKKLMLKVAGAHITKL